jgi:DNA ligase-1
MKGSRMAKVKKIEEVFSPMLASNYESVKEGAMRYPKMGSPKLDGIRALVQNGIIVSRNMKPIKNNFIREILSSKKLEGLDGELIVGSPTAEDAFRVSSSGVMTVDGEPNFRFHVFDKYHPKHKFVDRLDMAGETIDKFGLEYLTLVPHYHISDVEELDEFEKQFLDRGYEGMMLRCPDGLYKQGRASASEQTLLKVKRFSDAEAIVVGYEEEKTNTHLEKVADINGELNRPTGKGSYIGKGTLGKLIVQDCTTGVEFGLGSGFNKEDRESLWVNPDALIGRMVKYKFFKVGVKEAPRFPTFLGFRDPADVS